MKRWTQIWILSFSLMTGLSACHHNSYQPVPNKGPVEEHRPEEPAGAPEAEAQATGLLPYNHYLDVLASDSKSAPLSASMILSEVLKPLSEKILSTQVLTNREFLATNAFPQYLVAMHQSILKLAKIDANNPELIAELKRYEETVLTPCLERRNDCDALKYMGRDAGYVYVIMVLTKALNRDAVTSWNYLLYSMDYSTFPKSEEFSRFALQIGKEYMQYLSVQDADKVRRQVRDFNRVINQIVMASQGRNAAVGEFFNNIDIWGEDTDDLKIRAELRKALWTILIDRYAFVFGIPTRSFQGYLQRDLDLLTAQVADRFHADPHWQRVFDNYALKNPKDISNKNVLALINLAFNQKVQVKDLLRMMEGLNPKPDELLDIAESYIQLQFMYLTMATQEGLKAALGDPKSYTSMSELMRNLKKAQPYEVEWASFRVKLSQVRVLVDSVLAANQVPIDSPRTRKIFNNLPQNIKWSVIYPNTLPVVHFVAKSNLRDRLSYLWWSVTIDPDMIFENLFNGNLNQWFNFTNVESDDRGFTSPEVQLAFQNAILTELFESYKLKPSEFLAEAVNRLTTKSTVIVQSASEMTQKNLLTDYEDRSQRRNYFKRITNYCRGDRSLRETIELKDLTQNLHPFEPDLLGNVINTKQSNANPYEFTVSAPGTTFSSPPLYHLADFMRTRDLDYIAQIDNMVAFYSDYLKKYPNAEEEANMAKVAASLNAVRAEYRRFFGLVYQIIDRYDDCAFEVVKEGRERQLKVMAYEEKYLRRAYRDLKKVVADGGVSLDEVNQKYRGTAPDLDNYVLQDGAKEIAGTFVFAYNKADFMLRLRDYMSKGYDFGNGDRVSAVAPQLTITVPTDISTDVSLSKDTYQIFYRNDEFLRLTVTDGDTEDDFVRQAMQAFFATSSIEYIDNLDIQRMKFAEWNDGGNAGRIFSLMHVRLLMDLMLAKLGPVKVYDFEKAGCTYGMTNAQLDEKCVKVAEMPLDELIRKSRQNFDIMNIDPEFQVLLKKSGTSSFIRRDQMNNVAFSALDRRLIGFLDPIRFGLSAESIGFELIWPGTDMKDRGNIMPRDGAQTRARMYYTSVSSAGEPLLNPIEEIKGDLKGYYQRKIDQEFGLILEMEEKVKELKGSVIPLTYSIFSAPLEVPAITSYSGSPEVMMLEFNQQTGYIFAPRQ